MLGLPSGDIGEGQASLRGLPLALLLLSSCPAALNEQPQRVFPKHRDCWEVPNFIFSVFCGF